MKFLKKSYLSKFFLIYFIKGWTRVRIPVSDLGFIQDTSVNFVKMRLVNKIKTIVFLDEIRFADDGNFNKSLKKNHLNSV